jgi:hypothetical protein
LGVAFESPGTGARSAAGVLRQLIGGLANRRAVIYAFVVSRLALLAAGLMTQIFIEPFSSHRTPLELTRSAALRMWGQWDTGWYLTLAAHGYASQAGPDGQVNWVFFPAFPGLSALLAQASGLSLFSAMLLISNLSFLAALFLAHRFAREEFDRRTADIAVALICAAPGSYVFSSAYTESLFLLALTGCLVLLRARRWLAAGAFAALAVLTRNLGVGLLLPFAFATAPRLWDLAREAGARRPLSRARLGEGVRMAAGLALPLLALAGFCVFLYFRTGDAFAFVSAQKAWGRSLADPIGRAVSPLLTARLPDGEVVNFAACWLSISLVIALAVMRRWSLCVLAAFLTLLPLASGLTSFARYSLVALPLFLAAAKLLAPRPIETMAVLILLATVNGFMMVAWTLGMWVAV